MNQQENVYRVDATRVVWRAAGDEVVVLDTAQSVYFGLARPGALLWHRLVDGATHSDLVAALVQDEPVDPAQARADVSAFLDELHGHGLLPRP
ncbi:PqqD family protein [Micromonospora sp. NPDC002389]|uniref:PqqD family protein n=1 Tax=Micromonospora sp. NPDC002389 TaxID=3154272 RepID=UPI00331735D8